MGSCFSHKTTSSSVLLRPPPTSKVVTLSGELWEFSSPIQSSLLSSPTSSSFICNSDFLQYEEKIPAMGPEEFVLPGNLYFVLHVKMLEVPLNGEAMAGLAVKASDALVKSGKNVNCVSDIRSLPIWIGGDAIGVSSGKSGSGRKGRVAPVKLATKLGTIEENVF